MRLNLKVGDRVVRIMAPSNGFQAMLFHGNVTEVQPDFIRCKILADTWRTMEFDAYGAGKFNDFIVPVAPYAWLFSKDTVWWEV